MISERGYADAAQELFCDIAAIKAVASVESSGDGMLKNGQPKILFEAHEFSKRTNNQYDVTHPRISSPKWNKKLYIGGEGEHFRLKAAIALDREAALLSTSWGKFQIMGYNYELCGFKSLQSFVNAMYESEDAQLAAFVKFIKSNKRMHQALQSRRWATFARAYNGPGYMANSYDVKLEQAYKRFLN